MVEAAPTRSSSTTTAIQRPRCPRYLSLDIMRGAACLLVIVNHAACQAVTMGDDAASWVMSVFRLGWIGVPMFFVISGYCISATADASRLRFGERGVADYFRRRIRRIYPPYWVWLGICLLLTMVLSAELFYDPDNRIRGPFELSLGQWFGNLTLTETWRYHLGGDPQGLVFGPAWTLCYEEQFYFVTGAILLLCPHRFFRAAVVVSIATVLARVVSKLTGWSFAGFFFDGRWLLFALGIAVYYRFNYGSRRYGTVLAMAILAALVGIVFAPLDQTNKIEFGSGAAFALILLLLHRWDAVFANSSVLAPIKFCGVLCYSLYLTHWPTVLIVARTLYLRGVTDPLRTVTITVPLCLLVAIPVGWIFHVLVEKHFLNPSQRVVIVPDQRELAAASTAITADGVHAN